MGTHTAGNLGRWGEAAPAGGGASLPATSAPVDQVPSLGPAEPAAPPAPAPDTWKFVEASDGGGGGGGVGGVGDFLAKFNGTPAVEPGAGRDSGGAAAAGAVGSSGENMAADSAAAAAARAVALADLERTVGRLVAGVAQM